MKIAYQCRAIFLLLIILSGNSQAQVIVPNDDLPGVIQSLNGTWKFKYMPSLTIDSDSNFYKPDFDFKEWEDIKVPGHWELQGFAEPNYGKVDPSTGLYRTSFIIPENWKEKQLFIDFEGVQYSYDLWINGNYAGNWASSYNRQMFDITKYVNSKKTNTLAVKVSTRNRGFDFDINDCWALSGIYRDVKLIAVPKTHIKDLVVKTYVKNDHSAKLDLSVVLGKMAASKSLKKLEVSGQLLSLDGKLIEEFKASSINLKNDNCTTLSFQIDCKNIELWTAETPVLYRLQIALKTDGMEIQNVHKKIGFREISIENEVLKLNGQAIKLRGIDHHDIDPVLGRSLSKNLILKDLLLMKRANINFVRTSHYPPHPKMIDLCDSLGLYVMCEVPFGYGDAHLKDSTYISELLTRAGATLSRDKNHPSIIIWSIGNENPLTPIAHKTGQFVKKMDDTRPICYPQQSNYFKRIHKEIPDSIDIFAPHYGTPKDLEYYASSLNRPIIATEYSHSLGLDFDQMEKMWEIMYKYPATAGGAIWHFQDQGILRTADQKVNPDEFTTSVWLDSIHFYDNNGNNGADGIVYANRIPQVDYWQVRKVYSPVKAFDDSITIQDGSQLVEIKVNNRFDFTDLTNVNCNWVLTADNKSIQEGTLTLKCAPHDTLTLEVPLELPQKLSAFFYLLSLNFSDKENYQFYEKTYRLWPENQVMLKNSELLAKPDVNSEVKENKAFFTAKLGHAIFKVDKQNGNVRIEDEISKQLILEGPYARVGRKVTMAILRMRERGKSEITSNWDPYILKDSAYEVLADSFNTIECKYRFERVDKKGEYIEGSVIYTVADGGWIDVKFNFKPVNATALFLEAGISFQIAPDYTEMRWIGEGPYPAYPGKSELDEFGFYHLNSSDINFQGNRSNIQLMLMTDKNGSGLAMKCDNANVAVENIPDGLLLSHNALVSGRYTKMTKPGHLYQADEVKSIRGSFSILPVNRKNTPPAFSKLFGNLSKQAVPFKPFYHSYDQ